MAKIQTIIASLMLITTSAFAQYPSKPITIVSGFEPGGASEYVARTLMQKIEETNGWKFVFETRPGASGQIGTNYVAKSKPDGYTLILGPVSTHAIGPAVFKTLPYDVEKEFEAVTLIAKSSLIVAVHPNSKIKDTTTLILESKTRKLTYSTPGIGTANHLAGELLREYGIEMLHIPFKGSQASVSAVLGEQVDVLIADYNTALPFIQSQKLKAIAVTSLERQPTLPNVPTFNENGFKGLEVVAWFGIFAPSKILPEILSKLNEEFVKAINDKEIQSKLLERGLVPSPMSSQNFNLFWLSQLKKFKEVAQKANIRIE